MNIIQWLSDFLREAILAALLIDIVKELIKRRKHIIMLIRVWIWAVLIQRQCHQCHRKHDKTCDPFFCDLLEATGYDLRPLILMVGIIRLIGK